MKIRLGFVSNSSSSSFILRLPPKASNKFDKGRYLPSELLTAKDKQKAIKFGFRPVKYHTPSMLEHCGGSDWTDETGRGGNATLIASDQLGYCVSCDEDEVIEFLVRNNIPFSGSTHYGHDSCFFKRGDKTILWLANLGLSFEMYGHGKGAMVELLLDMAEKKPAIRREPIESYKDGTR